ncbi:hypothetical protein DFH06DRAFT_725129 [Mycena polygramma]|nr:hypothetical protein DFH06DRAFT_725129 [Mycena polygramma]
MAFISNAHNFTLGDGVYNNVHGNIVYNNYYGTKVRRDGSYLSKPGPTRKRPAGKRQLHEGTGLKIIRYEDVKPVREISSGAGYFLHAAQHKGCAVVVKVFNPGPDVRERLAATVALSRSLMHPNVLRIEGVSSPASLNHFIVYEAARRQSPEGQLARALKDGVTKSITLGFHMVAGLSAGMNYLAVQGISMRGMRVENFDIFLDVGDRFMLGINPASLKENDAIHAGEQEGERCWDLFNALCKKVLRSANDLLHTEKIERDPVTFDPRRLEVRASPESLPESGNSQKDESAPVPPRREYVWRTIDRGQLSLASVATQIRSHLELISPLNRLVATDWEITHRCAGYLREEITLATTTIDSAVVSHDVPSPREICPVCKKVVGPLFNKCAASMSCVGGGNTMMPGAPVFWWTGQTVAYGTVQQVMRTTDGTIVACVRRTN